MKKLMIKIQKQKMMLNYENEEVDNKNFEQTDNVNYLD